MSHDDSSLKRQNSLLNARPDDELFEELSHEEASRRAGLQLNNGGILFEKGGYIEPKALCQDLLSHKNINLKLSSTVEKIDVDNNNLTLIAPSSSVLIIPAESRISKPKLATSCNLLPLTILVIED